jgi:hypothetical protein
MDRRRISEAPVEMAGPREDIMKKMLVPIIGLALMAGLVPAAAGQVDVGISVGAGGVRGFYLSIGSYFRIPEAEVLALRDRYRVRDEELPVVFFLAARTHVLPSVIVNLRVRGLSWLDIAFRYNLTADIFFVPVRVDKIGPPYGNAYGHFRRYRARREWGRMVLSDREVVDLVNLRFISEYHRIAPETVMEMRGRGEAFVAINDEVVKKHGQPGKEPRGQPGKEKPGGDRRK